MIIKKQTAELFIFSNTVNPYESCRARTKGKRVFNPMHMIMSRDIEPLSGHDIDLSGIEFESMLRLVKSKVRKIFPETWIWDLIEDKR